MEKTKRSMEDEKIVNIVAVTSSEVGMIFRLMLNNLPKVLWTPIRTTTTWWHLLVSCDNVTSDKVAYDYIPYGNCPSDQVNAYNLTWMMYNVTSDT